MCVAAVQKPAPNFEGLAVVNKDFKTIKLSDYKGKYLVLFFYPLDLYALLLTVFYWLGNDFPVTFDLLDFLVTFCVALLFAPPRSLHSAIGLKNSRI